MRPPAAFISLILVPTPAVLPYFLKCASVFLLSMIKFFAGPVTGISVGLNFMQTLGLTVGGMMTTVLIISSVGQAWALHQRRRRQLKGKPVFTKRSRNIVRFFRRFGMPGIAFLTPILFSPIGGTVIATQLHVPRLRIFLHMFWSAVFWGVAITTLTVRFSHLSVFHH